MYLVNNDWYVHISRVKNGFVITTEDYDGEQDKMITRQDVIEEIHNVTDSDMEAQMAQDLCDYIIAYFNLGGSKHDNKRIQVTILNKGEHNE